MSKKTRYRCVDCGEICELKPIIFEYAGTHCTHGVSGRHVTGERESACCGADWIEDFYDRDDDSRSESMMLHGTE